MENMAPKLCWYSPSSNMSLYNNNVTLYYISYCVIIQIFWYESKEKGIFRASFNSNETEKIVSDVDYTDGIAYDWINHNVYWTDASNDHIMMAGGDGSNPIVIVNTAVNGTVEEPRAIVIDPFHK